MKTYIGTFKGSATTPFTQRHLIGKIAMVRDHPGTDALVQAQFADATLSEGYGWHNFPKDYFTIMESSDERSTETSGNPVFATVGRQDPADGGFDPDSSRTDGDPQHSRRGGQHPAVVPGDAPDGDPLLNHPMGRAMREALVLTLENDQEAQNVLRLALSHFVQFYDRDVKVLREALEDLFIVQAYATGWDNGVIDSTGMMNEGDYLHGLSMNKARKALQAVK